MTNIQQAALKYATNEIATGYLTQMRASGLNPTRAQVRDSMAENWETVKPQIAEIAAKAEELLIQEFAK